MTPRRSGLEGFRLEYRRVSDVTAQDIAGCNRSRITTVERLDAGGIAFTNSPKPCRPVLPEPPDLAPPAWMRRRRFSGQSDKLRADRSSEA